MHRETQFLAGDRDAVGSDKSVTRKDCTPDRRDKVASIAEMQSDTRAGHFLGRERPRHLHLS